MSTVSGSFYERTMEALAVAVVPRPANIPLVVLVVDDSADDELVSAIADASTVPATGYTGGWGAMAEGGPNGFDLTIKFLLKREEWERQWTLPEVTDELLNAVMDGPHSVALQGAGG